MAHENIGENPELSASGLTSAYQIIDTTSSAAPSLMDTTSKDGMIQIRTVYVSIHSIRFIPDNEFYRVLEDIIEEDDEILRRLAK